MIQSEIGSAMGQIVNPMINLVKENVALIQRQHTETVMSAQHVIGDMDICFGKLRGEQPAYVPK